MSAALAAKRLGLLFAAGAILAAPLIVREGYVNKGYADPVYGAKLPTACSGITEGVVLGRTYSDEECLAMNAQAVVKHTAPIMACFRDDFPISGADYVAEMADLSVNVGIRGFLKNSKGGDSTICARLKAADYKGACDAILLYKYAGKIDCSTPGNRVCRGVWTRRLESHAACLKALP